ncbi:MAG: hypothetical protein ACR2PC_08015 [Tsuneonella suprasediminis]
MTKHTRTAHINLLTRARQALAAQAREAGESMGIVVDLDAAIARIEQMAIPWSVPIHLGAIGHGRGTDVVALNHAGLLDQVARFCRAQWAEINDPRDPAGIDTRILVRDYFSRHPEDQFICRMELVDPDFCADTKGMEIGTYLALSSGHISWRTTLKLDEWLTLDPSDRPVSVADTHYGWFLCALAASFGDHLEIPDDLFSVLTFARDQGCNYLVLDRDAPVSDRLPCFEW